MDFQKFLAGPSLYRIKFWANIYDRDKQVKQEVNVVVDTGNINTLISKNLADIFSIENLKDELNITIGGRTWKSERHVLPFIEFTTDFIIKNVVVESVDFALGHELYNTILLGLNTLNNWDYKISNKDRRFYAVERFSILLPNRVHCYKNYFVSSKKNGKWEAEYSRLMAEELESESQMPVDTVGEFAELSKEELDVLKFASLTGRMFYMFMDDNYVAKLGITVESCKALVKKGFLREVVQEIGSTYYVTDKVPKLEFVD